MLLCVVAFAQNASAATYYVDSRTGSDSNNGLTPQTAWQSFSKVNVAEIKPGDQILFARGGLWRGVLNPKSGEKGNPVLYGAYGEGPLPLFYGSVDASTPEDWQEVKPGIWATKKIEPVVGELFNQNKKNGVAVQGDNNWGLHSEKGAKVQITRVKSGFKLKCEQSGTASNHIQIWGPSVTKKNLPTSGLMVTYRVRCSKKFLLPQITIQNSGSPWNTWFAASGNVELSDEWTTKDVFLPRLFPQKNPEENETLRYHLALGNLPSGSEFCFELLDVREASVDRSKLLYCDVGNIIFNHGNYKKLHRCGIKKWALDKCVKPGDYWYNADDRRVYLRFDGNPGSELDSIELALRVTMINQSNCHDIIYENLALAYGAAHGFGGGTTTRIIIRKCDVYYIGGGHQFTRQDGHPVRFGNGIEFWGNCDGNLVEDCNLWEIYDAALTNQGRDDSELNTTYRRNLIWNSEYSYEYWNAKITENIVFEDNICLDAGFGWAHGQRPDPNGGHLMFYTNRAATKNFVVRNNVFCESTEVCIRMLNDWRDNLKLEGNQCYQSEKPILRWYDNTFIQKDELSKMQTELGMDKTGTCKPFDRETVKARMQKALGK